ncbi:unnamed protein product [Nippostrongylus brasiliensis]|uniref:Adapter protein unc-53 (inferred by orthology to a C. elegans protein) n=1 Tax=Nippostrongylus brasiliensis TaxID=27835 RepID=A0A158R3B1_NIPBR|nr:unnamed protein product [Nippostrongylus brasiliensis]
MARDLEGYRHTISKLTRKQEDYSHVMEMFQNKLSQLSKQVDKSLLKPDDLSKLRQEIEQLRAVSGRLAQGGDAKKSIEGAGELLRQPSLESVASLASHRSSMSSSSKSSRTDKSSLNSFGKTKKSWTNGVDVQIRSSLTKAFSKKKSKNGGLSDTESSPHHALNTISGSSSRLEEIEVDELKKKLEDRDVALTDIRLDALDKAREHENKQLKSDMTRLLAGRGSRASSQASIPMLGDEEPVYEAPPSSSSGSYSSKRSSGCNSVKVTVNVDLRGTISSAICPDNEIIIGFLAIPGKEVMWEELDQQIFTLFEAYIGRIDPDHHLGLHCSESVIGYQMGDVVREKGAAPPDQVPGDVLAPTTTAVNAFIEKANSLDVTIGPRIFLQCPLGVEESRAWFVRLWNQNIVPYMVKVAREGVKVLGRCGSFEDPTDIVCEHWPWLDGPSGEECLNRLSIKETIAQSMPKQPFNPLDTLIRLQASRNAAVDNV